ncbi:unnamed protein product, partial [Phaeothamnion confervicola]
RATLLFGTALGCSIAILAASPNQAWAADECGADIAGSVICTATSGTGNPYPAGIDYVADAGEDITVILIGGGPITAVDVVTATDDGVTATGVAGFEANINAYLGSSVDAAYDGLQAIASGANATVVSYATIYAGEAGISVESTGAAGDTYVFNYGDITMDGDDSASGFVEGIYAESDETTLVFNTGYIEVDSSTDGYAYGIYADSDGLGYSAAVISTGDISVYNSSNDAQGIHAESYGFTYVSQTGYTEVHADEDATGIYAYSDGGNVSVIAADIYVEAYGGEAFGINADSDEDYVFVTVAGDIYTDVDDITEDNTGIYANGYDGATVSVTGDITLSDGDDAIGIDANSYDGDVYVDVTGNIQVGDFAGTVNTENATGIDAYSYNGDVDVDVTGNVAAFGDEDATGVEAYSNGGDVDVTVTGNVTAYANDGDGFGIDAYSYLGYTTVTVIGNIDVDAYDAAYGVYAYADDDAVVSVTGNITVDSSDGYAYGVYAYSYGDDVDVTVTGNIDVSGYNDAFGVHAYADDGDATVSVTGDITVDSSDGDAYGVYAYTDYVGSASVTVVGDITVDAYYDAYGVYAYGYVDATVSVTGDINVYAYDGDAYGVYAGTDEGDAVVTVIGNIDVESNYEDAYGVYIDAEGGDGTATVTGDITVYAEEDAYGVYIDADYNATATVTGNIDVTSETDDAYG